jgi:hypothetical protein
VLTAAGNRTHGAPAWCPSPVAARRAGLLRSVQLHRPPAQPDGGNIPGGTGSFPIAPALVETPVAMPLANAAATGSSLSVVGNARRAEDTQQTFGSSPGPWASSTTVGATAHRTRFGAFVVAPILVYLVIAALPRPNGHLDPRGPTDRSRSNLPREALAWFHRLVAPDGA